jgi:hypothetical protein
LLTHFRNVGSDVNDRDEQGNMYSWLCLFGRTSSCDILAKAAHSFRLAIVAAARTETCLSILMVRFTIDTSTVSQVGVSEFADPWLCRALPWRNLDQGDQRALRLF